MIYPKKSSMVSVFHLLLLLVLSVEIFKKVGSVKQMTEYDTTQAEIETQYSQITKYNVKESLFPFSIEVLDQDICGQEESYGYFSTLEG